MMDNIRHWNRKNIKNYVEIYIKSDLKLVMSKKKKKIYKKKTKNVVGLDIKAEYPKRPHIILKNDFKKKIEIYAKELLTKIDNHLN